MRYTILSLFLFACACAGEPPFPTDREARFAASLEQMQQSQESVGGIEAADDGAHRWVGAIGMADRSTALAMTPTTPYRTASLAKTFTGALILALHEEGALSVDDPLSTYLPSFPNGANITLRMMLTHTSGIANYTHIPAYIEADHVLSVDELIAAAAAAPPDFAPGTGWNYSNTGYIILGVIAEQVTGRALPDELQARFFGPLGMTHTHPLDSSQPDLARGYQVHSGEATEVPPETISGYPADGGWVTTIEDLLIWSRAFLGGHLHSADTLALARHPEGGELLNSIAQAYGFDSGGYALGFVQAHDATLGPLYAGAGNADGVRTFVGYLPERDMAFATFVDIGDGSVPLIETLEATRPMLEALRADAAH